MSESKFLRRPPRLGDVVRVKTTQQEGTVKFIGTIHFKTGTWVGIELFERGTGKNNGTIKGVTYFKCPPQTGLLVMASSVNVLKPAQKAVTNSQKASLVSKTIYKQPRKARKSISRPSESTTQTESTDTSRKIKTLPRTSKTSVIKVKPRPKSTIVNKQSYLEKSHSSTRLDRIKEETSRPPTQTNININMTMTASPKDNALFLNNRISPKSSMLLPKCEVDAEIQDDSNIKNINDAIINGLQNTLVHLKDIVSGLADEIYVKDEDGNLPLINIKQEVKENSQDGNISSVDELSNSQEIDSEKEKDKEKDSIDDVNNNLNNNKESLKYSSSSIPLNSCEDGTRMVKQSLKQVTDSQRTISELSIGLVNAQQEVRKLKENQSNLNRELSYYKVENKSLIERVADLEKQNQALSASSKEHYAKELEIKNKKLNTEYEQVKNELYFAKKNIEELYRKLEYNNSAKGISLYNKYASRSESRIARPKTYITTSKRNASYNNIYSQSRSSKDNGSSEFSYSESEAKLNETLIAMKEQNDKLILENETLHEEMEMLKNTLLDVQDDRENSANHFLEKMEYQEKKYDDLKLKYQKIEAEKIELLNHIESISSFKGGNKSEITVVQQQQKSVNSSSVDDAMVAEMKSLIADMEVTLTKSVKSEKEARSNFEAINELYEATKVKMDTLKGELEQRKMDYQLLSESNEALTKENDELKQAIEEMNQKQIQLQEQSNNDASYEELQKQYNQLNKQYEATKAIIEDKEAEMINYDVQCTQLEGQIIDFEKQLAVKQNEIDCLLQKLESLEKANNSQEFNDDDKYQFIQEQASKICMLEEEVKEYKDENNLLKIHNEESLNEISKLNRIKSDLEIEISNKSNEIEENKKAQEELDTNTTTLEKELKEKNGRIEELVHKNDLLQEEIKETNGKLNEILNEKAKVDKEIETLNQRMSENVQELESLTSKYENDKKCYEDKIYEITMDRDQSAQQAKEEIEKIIRQLSDTREQFETKVNQLENSKQMMQKKYETEIEDLSHQLELLANLQKQTEQAENLLELSTLLDESERAKEVAESNAENRRKLLEKVIVERDQLSQDLQSEKEKFMALKDDYEQCQKRINELEKEDLNKIKEDTHQLSPSTLTGTMNVNLNDMTLTNECSQCKKLKEEIENLEEVIEELSIYKTIDVQKIDNALKQSNEDIQKEKEEKEMLEKGYTLMWNSYISLENECHKLLDQLNQQQEKNQKQQKQQQLQQQLQQQEKLSNLSQSQSQSQPHPHSQPHPLPQIPPSISSQDQKDLISLHSHSYSDINQYKVPFSDTLSTKIKLNKSYDSIQDYTFDFDYDSVPDTNIINRDLMKGNPLPSTSHDNDRRTSLKTINSDNSPPSLNSYNSSKPEISSTKEKVPFSNLSESSSNTLYSPKRRSSLNNYGKYTSLPRTNPNRIRSLSNYKTQSVIFETLENNDDTLYNKPEDDADLIDYSSILQKSRVRSTSLYNINNNTSNNNKYSYHN